MPRLALLALIFLWSFVANAASSKDVSVPGEVPFQGHATFQCWFKPHPTFFNRHERDLYGESAILNIRSLVGAHEVFINGRSIGQGGGFPPNFTDGSEGNHRHKIPSGLLIKDQWNALLVKVYQPTGVGGFKSEAPFIMNYFWECTLEGKWAFQEGNLPLPDMPTLKAKPSHAFDTWVESNRVLGRAEKLVHGEKLPPEESHAAMSTAEGLSVDLMLSEPEVAQPTHFSFDAKGRLWVAQYRQYPYPAGLKMVSRDRYYRSHYDRMPPAPPHHDRGADVVSIHEDTNGDGNYDTHKVFQDGLNMANSALRGRGGVWIMNTPYLLFYPDRDFNDIPDGPPVVHLQGFGLEDTHSVANGLTWGMDGWLYGAQGSTASCHVTRPGLDGPEEKGVYFQGCMVWRYHPETRRFEIFAEGGGNNFGLEVDSGGRLFTGNNGGQTRGWHYLQGGISLMQGTTPNKFGPPRNPFAFGTLPKMESRQDIPRFTHFATLVEGPAFPKRYHGSFLSMDPLHNFVIASKRHVEGATFVTSDQDKVLTSEDFAFRPVFIGNAPDGSVLIADFYEHYIAHGQHYQSQIDPTTGRIFRLRGTDNELLKDVNLEKYSSKQLLAYLKHPNRWHRHTAVRLLGERKDASVRVSLEALISHSSGHEALCALWATYQAFGLKDEVGLAALDHETALVRYWAVRLLCDDIGFGQSLRGQDLNTRLGTVADQPTSLSSNVLARVIEQARYERNAEARSQIASSARRLPASQGLALLEALVMHDEDLGDKFIPMLCWWVIEANLDFSRDEIIQLFEKKSFLERPMVARHLAERLMRALALKGRQRDLLQATQLLKESPSIEVTRALLKGFELAYQGRSMGALPTDLAKALIANGKASLELRLRLGDKAAIADSLKILPNTKSALTQRQALIRVLGELAIPEAKDSILKLLQTEKNNELRRASLAALGAYDDPAIATQFINLLSSVSTEMHPAVHDLLLSRKSWATSFVDAIGGRISESSISADIRTRLINHSSTDITAKAKKLFETNKTTQPDHQETIKNVETILSKGTGNPYAGEATFMNRCAACHKLFHKGGNIGPDLTPYQRGNLDTLLSSLIDPNAEIREGFNYVALETKDGRQLSGFLTDEDTQIVALRGMTGEDIRIEQSNVESLTPMGRSLMPEGLLQGLSDQELRDFFAYLRISQPISR